ncbi:BrnA antitoxin family protein [Rhodosalinus halophilus]|nr:BrnA antitoxin family protein [Rhodosalinus halophilus]
MTSETDWQRLRQSGDHEGEQEIDVDWTTAKLVEPAPKKLVSLRIDKDVLDYFRATGKGYQTRMNAVLRAYMEAQKRR